MKIERDCMSNREHAVAYMTRREWEDTEALLLLMGWERADLTGGERWVPSSDMADVFMSCIVHMIRLNPAHHLSDGGLWHVRCYMGSEAARRLLPCGTG